MDSDSVRLYTVREAAAVLKVHERTVLRWIKSGRLPARRIGRQIRIDEETLRTWGEPASKEGQAKFAEGGEEAREPSAPPKGSPEAVLRCAGLLTESEAEELMAPIRRAHDEDWEERVEISA